MSNMPTFKMHFTEEIPEEMKPWFTRMYRKETMFWKPISRTRAQVTINDIYSTYIEFELDSELSPEQVQTFCEKWVYTTTHCAYGVDKPIIIEIPAL